MRSFVLVAFLLAASHAAPVPARTTAELNGLLEALRTSGCQFQRNGSWYDAPAAAAHLAKKRAWLEDHDRIRTAEDFIRLGGTESSMSGKAYEVKCPDHPVLPSKVWLEAQLARLRAPKTP